MMRAAGRSRPWPPRFPAHPKAKDHKLGSCYAASIGSFAREGSMKLFSSLLCIFSLLLPSREVTAAELPQKLSSAVRAAEADGLSLFKASGQPRTIDNPAIEDARRKITNFCEFDYAPVVISRGGVP